MLVHLKCSHSADIICGCPLSNTLSKSLKILLRNTNPNAERFDLKTGTLFTYSALGNVWNNSDVSAPFWFELKARTGQRDR